MAMKRLALAIVAGLSLSACSFLGLGGRTVMDDLADAEPQGSAFNRALFADYAYLAKSFGDIDVPEGDTFDQSGSSSMTANTMGGLAAGYARKALDASKGIDVSPEPARTVSGESIRSRLVRAILRGRDYAPEAAARAQVDYDCWVMNARVPQQLSASDQCKHSLDITLPRLERTVQQAR
jgi:hypothetical protein